MSLRTYPLALTVNVLSVLWRNATPPLIVFLGSYKIGLISKYLGGNFGPHRIKVSSFMMKQAVYLGVKVFLWARQVRSENTKVQHVPLVEKQAVNIFFKSKHWLVQVCHSVLSFHMLLYAIISHFASL